MPNQPIDPELQQRCCEIRAMLTSMTTVLPTLFPVDASNKDVQIDLLCLDGIRLGCGVAKVGTLPPQLQVQRVSGLPGVPLRRTNLNRLQRPE